MGSVPRELKRVSVADVVGDSGLPWAVVRALTVSPTPRVVAETVKLMFVTSGSSTLLHPDGESVVTAGSVVTIPAGLWCAARPLQPVSTITLYMRRDFLRDQLRWMAPAHPLTSHLNAAVADGPQLRSSFVQPRARQHVLPLLHTLAAEGVVPGREFRAYAHIAQLFDLMMSSGAPDHSGSHRVAIPRSRVVDRATALIDSNPERSWRVGELARAVSMSPSQLTRLFSKHLRMTPAVYMREQRLQRMVDLLGANDLSVSEAAQLAGWTSRSTASRSFKARFGVNPRSFASRSAAGSPPRL